MANKRDKLTKFWPKIVKMATVEERLTSVVEQLVLLQTQNQANALIRDISYIPEYGGEPNRLTHFLSVVDTHLKNVSQEKHDDTFKAIYNVKIVGRAKELLLNNAVTTWDQAKLLLTQHFRPLYNNKDIARKIYSIKVSTIAELCIQIENILSDINSFTMFEPNRNSLRSVLEATLVTKIKDIVCGNLARDLRAECDIHCIKNILYTYVGFDENLEKSLNKNPNFHPHPKPKPQNQNPPNFRETHNQNGSNRFRNPFQQSDRFRNNRQTFNPSGQFRNAPQNPQPMDVDLLETQEANNNIDQVFLN